MLSDSSDKTGAIKQPDSEPQRPEPIDYGLTADDLCSDFPGFAASVRFKKRKFRTETFLNILFYASTAIFVGYTVLNRDVHPGDERLGILLGLGLTWFASVILLGFLPDIIASYKRRHPSAAVLAYREAMRQYESYIAAARKAEEAARAAAHEAELRKRSY